MPDATIFDTIEFVGSTEVLRMKQAAYLTPGVTFTIVDKRNNIQQRFYYEGGIKTQLKNLIGEQTQLSSPHYFKAE